jgi:hypothetical protein
MIIVTPEQEDLLNKNNFYYIKDNLPHVYGHVKGQPNGMEIYNTESLHKLLEEIEANGEPLKGLTSVFFNSIKESLYSVEHSRLNRVSMKKNPKTGEREIVEPIRSYFWEPYIRLICDETPDYYCFVRRYNGEFGDGNQFIERAYKTKEAAFKEVIPLIHKTKLENDEQNKLLDTLLNKYSRG